MLEHITTKDDFEKLNKDGIFIFHSEKCWTCHNHIQEMKKLFPELFIIHYDNDVDYYESIGITQTPLTAIYRSNENIYQKAGMLFDTQLDELRRYL